MSKLYSAAREAALKNQLRSALTAMAAIVIAAVAAAAAVLLIWGVSLVTAAALWAVTAAAGAACYAILQRKVLPLRRTHALLEQLQGKQAESFEGIFRGVPEGKSMHSGVMMYRLLLDEGTKIRKEAVYRELNVPAIFGKPELAADTLLRGEAVGGVVTKAEALAGEKLRPVEGRYQVVPVIITAITLAALVLWGGVYEGFNKQSAETTIKVAVCTPAHHDETGTNLEDAMKPEGMDISFSYTNTIENEAVATYLATFGAMDADILLLNGDHYLGIFDNEGHIPDEQTLIQALGFTPRFALDEAGNKTAVVLYDPQDPQYSASFPRLIDWIAVEKDVALLATIRYGSPHYEDGTAQLALTQLLVFLAGK